MIKQIKPLTILVFSLLVVGCGGGTTPGTDTDTGSGNPGADPGTTPNPGGGGGSNALKQIIDCPEVAGDSTLNGSFVTLNTALDVTTPRYGFIASVRKDLNNNDISIDYMVHEPIQFPRGLVVLIAGGKLNAAIEGVNGGSTTSAGANFLVRSAQFFADAGFRTVTVDRPSDFARDVNSGDPSSDYDSYRTSSRHATDLSSVINAVSQDIPSAPVFIAGTSRGAISAVVQQGLGAALLLSSPVTSGSGSPIAENTANFRVRPSAINKPTQVLWHGSDQCGVTAPFDSSQLVTELDQAGVATKGIEVFGGFNDPSQSNNCQANTNHGFLGVETCAVRQMTDWAADTLLTLPVTRPAIASGDPATLQTPAGIQFRFTVSANGTAPFTFSLPHSITDLMGVIELDGSNQFLYTPPVGLDNTTDSFVYVATDANGGTSSNVIRIRIN